MYRFLKIAGLFFLNFYIAVFLFFLFYVDTSNFLFSDLLDKKFYVNNFTQYTSDISFIFFYIFFSIFYLLFFGPITPLLIINSVIFGNFYAVLVSLICLSISTLLQFYAINKIFGKKTEKIQYNFNYLNKFKKIRILFVILVRSLTIIPFHAQTIALFILRTSYLNIFFGTFVGMVPGCLIVIYGFSYIKMVLLSLL